MEFKKAYTSVVIVTEIYNLSFVSYLLTTSSEENKIYQDYPPLKLLQI